MTVGDGSDDQRRQTYGADVYHTVVEAHRGRVRAQWRCVPDYPAPSAIGECLAAAYPAALATTTTPRSECRFRAVVAAR